MKRRLLALAAALSAAGAGSLLLVNRDTGEPVTAPPGAFEILNRSACSVAACNANLCNQAENVLADAGSTCTTRLVTCDVRVGAQARAWATANGLTLGPQRYQRLRFVGLRCPGADGGSSFGVPMGDDGLPQFASLAQQTPLCVRAPVAGGTSCQRSERDGGFRFFGSGNVFPATESNGDPSCKPVGCSVLFGDDADRDL
ncbi:MAG: hypothetical protein IPJ65_42755 [Archangiaceae bacterium]|nr:hypothetical protein [Archangiaceae bacterium]